MAAAPHYIDSAQTAQKIPLQTVKEREKRKKWGR
jgi:hypothetical protein